MKSFHKTMGYLAGIFTLMIIVSITIASSYMTRNNISFISLFEETSSLEFDNNFEFKLDNLFNNIDLSSRYDTKLIEDSQTFDLVKEIFISSSIEEIVFIQEEREDIKVDYFRELPDSKYYSVDYNINDTNSRLNITATMSVSAKNLTINNDYKGSITIYVPKEYLFDKITLDSSISTLKSENIYPFTKNLTLISSLGDIDIDITEPLNSLNITSKLGSIKLEIKSEINKLYINCDLGKINLTIDESIGDLAIEENLGDIKITSNAPIGISKIHNNMGKLEGTFTKKVESIDFSTNMGSIDISLLDNDDISIYTETNLGSVESDFPTASKEQTDFIFTSNMGKIKVQQD